ncbi:MAG TPA: hypothetical protein VFO16_21755 [Pseudonocardiaceae bacterium]|nr:hypothetical protein [Pseudonocardiaceae bacterium]
MGTKFIIGTLGAAAVMGLTACSAGSDAHGATIAGTRQNGTVARARSGYPHGIAGKITAENGSAWTLNAADGTQYTVNITPQTQFGATWAPSTAQQFPVGSGARVTGTINDHTIAAARITAPRRKNPSVTPSTPPAS